ncbi:Sip1-related alpha-galactosidase [Mariniflexile sp. AS56]|uniref:Sip1-related alpha-galactosidase n=1 Tax=Mariniflexile sp. AS56 TaxID=3063957 RepID=UPI0026EAA079|nr:Sip1-related alpha-galactosidase [Mariniflexile sp. AS56]MDO7172375.1 Sip1-related alpha-galactosidase [Mariniflexile sp. AS56]
MKLFNNYSKIKTAILFTCGVLVVIGCGIKDVKPTESTSINLKEIPNILDLRNLGTTGLYSLNKQLLSPNGDGIIAEVALKLPEYQNGMYYRPFSEKLASGNRMEALWFTNVSELSNYKKQKPREDDNMSFGSFILLQKNNGNYLAILPIVSKMLGNTFDVEKDHFSLQLATYGTQSIDVKVPLFSYAEASSPYEATRLAWELAKEAEGVKGNFNWRSNKEYPEPFKYLGWCTWEHFKKDINEDIITTSIHDIKTSDLPIRWVLIDDGYLDQRNGQLLSFGVDKVKFPNGWKTITSLKDDKIKWMGIWRNFNGYMGGVSTENSLEGISSNLDTIFHGKNNNQTRMMAKNTQESANAFYEAMTSDTKNNGFDMIKVDFQSMNLQFNKGKENPVLGVHYNNRALETKVKEKNLKLLNCIAMQNFNVFNQTYSNIIRSSVDYKIDLDRIDLTIVQNFTNALWLGHVHWLDQDMFHTSFKETARLMAVSRAISGGPIYLSDETKNIDATYLNPLMYNDGEIVGTLAPGVPLPESLKQDPYVGNKAFKVIAPLKNKSASIMAVNLNKGTPLNASISINDYPFAGGMIQPYAGLWDIPKEGILLYDAYGKTAKPLTEDFNFELKTREERLFQLSPIIEGWAVIGRTDKYLAAGTVEVKSISKSDITVTMKESGPLTVWSKNGVPKINGVPFKSLGGHLYISDVAMAVAGQEIKITR